MTKEQYYWNIYRPQMLRQAVAGFAKKEEPQPVSETLTVNLVWDALTVPAAQLYINGKEEEYGKPIELQPGDFTIKVVCASSGERFRRFSVEDPSTDHSTYEYETVMTFSGTSGFDAVFSTEWS